MKQKIIKETDGELDELIVRARADSVLKRMMKEKGPLEESILFSNQDSLYRFRQGKGSEARLLDVKSKYDDSDGITSIAQFYGKTYFVLDGGLYDLETQKEVLEDRPVLNVCASKYHLYTTLNIMVNAGFACEIQMRNKDLSIEDKSVVPTKVKCACMHDNKLYYARSFFLYVGMENIASFGGNINSLCTFEGMIWAAHANYIESLSDDGNDESYKRESEVKALCVYRGQLCDGGAYGIKYTKTGESLLKSPVTAMATVFLEK